MNDNQNRVRWLGAQPIRRTGAYVLYWMQIYRRLSHNHALDFALAEARRLGLPLVIYEGLRLDYPWASARLHHFVLEGMVDNWRYAQQHCLNYWPFVATAADTGRGLLRRLSARAALIVSDDFPCFIIPQQNDLLAAHSEVAMAVVDSNSLVPLSTLGAPTSAAAHFRPRLQKAFAANWLQRAHATPDLEPATRPIDALFELWSPPADLTAFVASLPIDQQVSIVTGTTGGTSAGRQQLQRFIRERLPGYAERRSLPNDPAIGHASGLSPYLHFGHLSIQEIAEAVLAEADDFDLNRLAERRIGRRDGFYCTNADINGFLDEALTWRDVGFHWHWHRRADTKSLATALPAWAQRSLDAHASDPREYVYRLEEWEAAATHDPLWNAAQQELVRTGVIHNYLRMLWGKKVLEWSKTPEHAYGILEHLNNKYALDGRNPNSYTGILWCFGLFDRPWPPERPVFGNIRFMSSANTAKKFKLGGYYEYVSRLAA